MYLQENSRSDMVGYLIVDSTCQASDKRTPVNAVCQCIVYMCCSAAKVEVNCREL